MALTPAEQVEFNRLKAKMEQDIGDASGKKTLVVFKVLDASYSMRQFTDSTLSTYNESHGSLAEVEGDVFVQRIDFASLVTPHPLQKYADSDKLTHENYWANGNTALYDAIGKAFEIANAMSINDKTSFLLEILTDGEENASQKWTPQALKNEISRRKELGWTVTVMGPKGSVDIFENIGISKGNIAQYDVNSLRSRGGVTNLMRKSADVFTQAFNCSDGYMSMDATYAVAAGVSANAAADVDTWLDQQAKIQTAE